MFDVGCSIIDHRASSVGLASGVEAMFILEKRYAEEMVAHAKAEAPYEACGLLAGKDGQIVRLYRCQSAEKSPFRYVIEPKDQLKALREIDENGWELLGIYHSHTRSPAYPSKTDVELAFYPEATYLIISLMNPGQPAIRGFRIINGQVSEEELKIEG
ncbi:MAG: M67 family metallopeptidase [candidate division NC10 bacterium]|nr:M67 family metallopeptidase [candidate division NC10 bacterium]